MTLDVTSDESVEAVIGARPQRRRKRAVLLVAFSVLAPACCVYTQPFRAANGTILPDSIATMRYATIGGTR